MVIVIILVMMVNGFPKDVNDGVFGFLVVFDDNLVRAGFEVQVGCEISRRLNDPMVNDQLVV